MQKIDFELRGDYIALDALLKATGLAESGGTAKQMIVGGDVLLDGEVETRRSRKIRAGCVVQLGEAQIVVQADPNTASTL